MDDQELNIAIAETCGWQILVSNPYEWVVINPEGLDVGWSSTCEPIATSIPDYCNDLNAMHEAEVQLARGRQLDYAEALMDAVQAYPIGVVPDWNQARYALVAVAHATARQRAEAFYRILYTDYKS